MLEVFFVLEDFEGDLWSLSRAHPVWLVNSKHNSALAGEVRARASRGHSSMYGVTTFDGSGDRSEDFYSFLGTIDLHHGELSAPEPWSAIHVRGISLPSVDKARVAGELDVDGLSLLPEPGGFAIRR